MNGVGLFSSAYPASHIERIMVTGKLFKLMVSMDFAVAATAIRCLM